MPHFFHPMKTALIAILCLLIGFASGTFYGWRTGIVDGQTLANEQPKMILEIYDRYRTTNDIPSRDKAIDMLALSLGVRYAIDSSLSPMAYFIQPKADCGLIDIAAWWQLNHPAGDRPLFSPGTPEAKRLEEVMAKYPLYYDITFKRQADKQE
jgi:hypothetical protein